MKIFAKSFGLLLLGYIICSMILFGSAFSPLWFILKSRFRISSDYWLIPMIASSIFPVAICGFTWKRRKLRLWAPTIFLTSFMTIFFVSTVIYVDGIRGEYIANFKPDKVIQKSLFLSVRNVPRHLQFFLHAAAMKECVPYAWSYREMAFYRVPEDAVHNVFPRNWLEECNILRR